MLDSEYLTLLAYIGDAKRAAGPWDINGRPPADVIRDMYDELERREQATRERDEALAVLHDIADARGLTAELWRRIDAIVKGSTDD